MVSNKIYISIIPARGGSKGIKKKNMYPVLGKPLLYWTLKSSLESKSISQTWVTSDDVEILDFAKQNGANIIKRPQSLSKDFCTSESAWSHAIQYISKNGINFTEVVGLQATSPIEKIMILIKQFFILKSLELIACFLDVQLLIIYFGKKI